MKLRRKEMIAAPPLESHREYVGGLWDEIGRLQFDFLVARGLRPEHRLLDIACGSLRGGVHFIRYLDPGNYLGIDKEATLIERGVELELGRDLFEEKRPELVVGGGFEFSKFSARPDFSLAQSLFTHLEPGAIRLCLHNLRQFVEPGHVFYATFFEGSSADNPASSHDHARFAYTREELAQLGAGEGWASAYIGDWDHPRGQKMMQFIASEEA